MAPGEGLWTLRTKLPAPELEEAFPVRPRSGGISAMAWARGVEPGWQDYPRSGIYRSIPIEEVRLIGFILSSFFSFVATALSFWLIYEHLRRNTSFVLRRPTLRILLMVPIYSLQAFTAMYLRVSHTTDHVFKFFREAYEALVIFSFLQFVLACIGGADAMLRVLSTHREDGSARELKHIPVLEKCLPAWPRPEFFMRFTVLGTLQYVLFSLIISVTGFVLYWVDKNQHQNHQISEELSLLSVLLMASQGIAVYSLVCFAYTMMPELRPFRPYGKFLAVKAVIFFTLWQAQLLYLMAHLGVFVFLEDAQNDSFRVAVSLQNFLITFEMLVASIFHMRVFPPEDCQLMEVGPQRVTNPVADIMNVVNPGDFRRTVEAVRTATRRSYAPTEPINAQLVRSELSCQVQG
jgi:hypothetical protein